MTTQPKKRTEMVPLLKREKERKKKRDSTLSTDINEFLMSEVLGLGFCFTRKQ